MTSDALRETFFEECEELIEALTEDLETVAGGDWDTETINAIFRAVHSIKGAAGAFGFENLVSFAHKYETVLDLIRSDKLDVGPDVLRLITLSADTLAELVDCSRSDTDEVPASVEALAQELEVMSGGPGEAGEPEAEEDFVFAPMVIMPDIGEEDDANGLHIKFKPFGSLYLNGHEPQKLIGSLKKFGDLDVSISHDSVPPLSEFNFDEGYVEWDITVRNSDNRAEVEDVFAFVEGLCTLDFSSGGTNNSEDVSQDVPLAEAAPVAQLQTPSPAVAKPVVAKKTAEKPSTNTTKPQSTLRVDPERVDRLINSVGELIINQAVISQNLKDSGIEPSSDTMTSLEDYGTLARDIQEAVMAIRAQPVKALFQRMGRVVREAAEATGKSISFVSEGEATEIDKTMLERLADPLTHMLRNAVDHGIEDTELRASTGKSSTGTVRLSAAHRSGSVVIEIVDDGAGLNRERLLSKAIEKGIVSADAKLSEAEIDALLFAPGFSTAENLTNLSGRGVGMDVVKTAITSLGGKVGISSLSGKGSTFTISLPLTLAVMDGMIVQVGQETMVIPLSSVVETVRSLPEDIHESNPGEWVLSVRGVYVPIIDLGALLGMKAGMTIGGQGTFVLISTNGSIMAIALEAIDDQRQVVIKSLEGNYGSVPGIAAATILGDGKIALIVDPEALSEMAMRKKAAHKTRILEGQH